MLKFFVKMKTRCFLLGILYVANIFNSFSNSQILLDSSFEINDLQRSGNDNLETIKICQQSIITHISNRYASTVVTTTVTNIFNEAQEYIFSFHAPNNAFITKFVIEMNDKNYTSKVLDKEEADKKYKRTNFTRTSKGWKTAQVRNTQQFSIPINLEALSMATLYLTYEELLIKSHGRYEHVINIFPGQVVENLYVEVFLKETSNIIDLKIPNLRSGNEIENQNKELNPQAYTWVDRQSESVKSAKVLFMPKEEEQRKFARIMKTNENRGLAGQFVVQYDVENNREFGEIIVANGYFANFFSPKGLDPLVKHVIFVLDTSGSMSGIRLQQLKVSMEKMLNQLRRNDLISLVKFDSEIEVKDLESSKTVRYTKDNNINKTKFPKPSLATPANIKKSIEDVNKFEAPLSGGTDILSSLKVGLKLVELGKNFDKIERQPLIMFLTDDKPTVGERSYQKINEQVSAFNLGVRRSPISTFAFGNSTNQEFLRELALLNMGFFERIYDAEDSQLQIEDFFKTISVPVLANVNFKYNFPTVKNITKMEFPICYDGLELIVAGQYVGSKDLKQPMVEALSAKGALKKQVPQVYNSDTEISHLWAFLMTTQLLNKILINSGKNRKDDIKKILQVSLKYSFVTPFTSMLVAKPDGKVVIGTADLIGESKFKPGKSFDDTMTNIYG